MDDLFRHGPRSDLTARSYNEPLYEFLNRSGEPLVADMRRLMTGWLSHVPSMHVTDLRCRLQSKAEAEFESAFWELYLHEAYQRSGYRLTIHPVIAGITRHPDFLVEGNGTRFYLEAVRAGASSGAAGGGKRLEDAQRVLDPIGADQYLLDMAIYAVGAQPLQVKTLRRDLREWLMELDQDAGSSHGRSGSRALYRHSWSQADGWRLEFTAQQLRAEDAGRGLPLIRSYMKMGWGHDAARILGVLDDKANRYGTLDAPLVIAVLSNSEFRADDADVQQALFGNLFGWQPGPEPPGPGQLLEPGHWCTGGGWRRGHAPQVITIHGLFPWTVAESQPRVWTTLQPGLAVPAQPGWLAAVQVTDTLPAPAAADSPADLFGLPAGWPGQESRFVAQARTVAL
jgi:hypothetical protein